MAGMTAVPAKYACKAVHSVWQCFWNWWYNSQQMSMRKWNYSDLVLEVIGCRYYVLFACLL